MKEHELPNLIRTSFSLCSLKERYVFLTGGKGPLNRKTKKVERFDTTKSSWETMPNLNKTRVIHSSCCLGGSIYVFGGDKEDETTGKIQSTSIERLCKAFGP